MEESKREFTRRLSTWQGFSVPDHAYGLRVRAIPSPSDERAESQWRIDDVLAGASSSTTLVDTYLFVTGTKVADLSTTPATLDTLSTLITAYPDISIVGSALAFKGVSALDFHPLYVNPHENLGIAVSMDNSGGGVAVDGMWGYTISYTTVSKR